MAKRPTSVRLSAQTERQIEELASRWGANKTEVIGVAVDRLYQEETVNRVTRQTVEQWLDAHRPELQAYQHDRNKGVYRRDVGPAHGFRVLGQTWREVLEQLKFASK